MTDAKTLTDLITMLRIMGMPRCVQAADLIEQQAAEIERLGAERDALREDAERYRWLRSILWDQELRAFSKGRFWLWSTRFASSLPSSGDLDDVTRGLELDAAIDAARKYANP